MKYYCIPDKLIRTVKRLYDAMLHVEDEEESEWFRVTTNRREAGMCNVRILIFSIGDRIGYERTLEGEPPGIPWNLIGRS